MSSGYDIKIAKPLLFIKKLFYAHRMYNGGGMHLRDLIPLLNKNGIAETQHFWTNKLIKIHKCINERGMLLRIAKSFYLKLPYINPKVKYLKWRCF